MANPIWRLTKTGTQAANNTDMLAGLPGGRTIDIPANRVTIRWGGSSPFGSSLIEGAGSTGTRVYVRNQTLNIKTTGSTGNNDFAFLAGSGNSRFTISHMELIDDYGYGRILYSYAA